MADFIYCQNQMPADQIDDLLDIIASSLPDSTDPLFENHNDIYDRINEIAVGEVPWQCFTASYSGALPAITPPWMLADYDIWFRDPRTLVRNQLANADFKDEVDYAAKQVFDDNHKRVWSDFMSGNWAWEQAVRSTDLVTEQACQLTFPHRTRLQRIERLTAPCLSQ